MILDSVILHNFGAYGGYQEAVLTPEDDKPIILFGGMNGGGKTTLLDAIQLAFYGAKARLSNRGRLSYRDYLRESIHRGSEKEDGAGVTVRFHRMIKGAICHFEIQRFWRAGVKGVEETISVLRDGIVDNVMTEHWDESIDAYLPSSIAHLFFFDGEQIKDLAEGGHAAEILGTAIHSLLGLDVVDRLEADLKVFERRKRSEKLDDAAVKEFAEASCELERIDKECENLAWKEGVLVNDIGRFAKELKAKEDLFRIEGGDLYLRRADLENELNDFKKQKMDLEALLRELASGSLPLLLVDDLLCELENVAHHEAEIIHARVMLDALEARDKEVLDTFKKSNVEKDSVCKIERILRKDRTNRIGLSKKPLLLNADSVLIPQLNHLRKVVLAESAKQADDYIVKITVFDEKITRLECEIDRVPTAERIAVIQRDLGEARRSYDAKVAELNALRIEKQVMQRQRGVVEARLDKLGETNMSVRFAEDDRQRILKHSNRVRETLAHFRKKVIQRHASKMENLMFESFRKLLHNTHLVTNLAIDPVTFETSLKGRDGNMLAFDRLSAGEKQLLATSLLWGLARASGRPVPTIIDTPLGRLDSSHRRHLIERYFPNASHQVLLLSTDEEIVGPYYQMLKPFITRSYLLKHSEESGKTNIEPGYFNEIASRNN
jgi:DNA sulfur modification protein DndD